MLWLYYNETYPKPEHQKLGASRKLLKITHLWMLETLFPHGICLSNSTEILTRETPSLMDTAISHWSGFSLILLYSDFSFYICWSWRIPSGRQVLQKLAQTPD